MGSKDSILKKSLINTLTSPPLGVSGRVATYAVEMALRSDTADGDALLNMLDDFKDRPGADSSKMADSIRRVAYKLSEAAGGPARGDGDSVSAATFKMRALLGILRDADAVGHPEDDEDYFDPYPDPASPADDLFEILAGEMRKLYADLEGTHKRLASAMARALAAEGILEKERQEWQMKGVEAAMNRPATKVTEPLFGLGSDPVEEAERLARMIMDILLNPNTYSPIISAGIREIFGSARIVAKLECDCTLGEALVEAGLAVIAEDGTAGMADDKLILTTPGVMVRAAMGLPPLAGTKPVEPGYGIAGDTAVVDKDMVLKAINEDMVLITPGVDGKNTGSFSICKYAVTQRQWLAVMGTNPSHFKGDDTRPVEMVSWDDCQEFIKRLNAAIGDGEYRLPTEAEWEYAAGEDPDDLDSAAWYAKNSDRTTHSVGKKSPNTFGLYDMLGNVWEWCQDLYSKDGSARVDRGGSWGYVPVFCRSAFRHNSVPGDRGYYLGLRLARSVS